MKKLTYTKRDGWHESKRTCPQCNELLTNEGHFVPPSLGEEGFYICEALKTIHDDGLAQIGEKNKKYFDSTDDRYNDLVAMQERSFEVITEKAKLRYPDKE